MERYGLSQSEIDEILLHGFKQTEYSTDVKKPNEASLAEKLTPFVEAIISIADSEDAYNPMYMKLIAEKMQDIINKHQESLS